MYLDGFFIDNEQYVALDKLSKELHGGSDAMRDVGHKLWLLLHVIAEQQISAYLTETNETNPKLN
jgi:hypothetical protein